MFRTHRSAVVAMGLALCGALVVDGALASDPEAAGSLTQDDFVIVTGTGEYTGSGTSFAGTEMMSDPRVSGTSQVTNTWKAVAPDNTAPNWGQLTITNEDGTWEGEWAGFWEPEGGSNLMAWLSGTGDYEGWSYIVNYAGPFDPGGLSTLTAKGLMYRGDIAPTVALGSVQAETG